MSYIDTVKDFTYKDIQVAIDGDANYLAALGLSTYTEILGGLYAGDLMNNLGDHYISFINAFFPSEYMTVNSKLVAAGFHKGLYTAVRSGLTHEYFIKRISKVETDNMQGVNCGITYNPTSTPQIIFYVRQYFKDFKDVFEEYQQKLNNDSATLTNFQNALVGANCSLIRNMSGRSFASAVSGGWSGYISKGPTTP